MQQSAGTARRRLQKKHDEMGAKSLCKVACSMRVISGTDIDSYGTLDSVGACSSSNHMIRDG